MFTINKKKIYYSHKKNQVRRTKHQIYIVLNEQCIKTNHNNWVNLAARTNIACTLYNKIFI